ncbi:hypothetical protein [Polaromonas sp. A23]|uniref:hypothetical protein n=1 Tax=Polaromonas sp. A23 TaxID=1944133 RepID=UPI000984CD41|nr:hypothetical protein [Polaromonas sp. A23]
MYPLFEQLGFTQMDLFFLLSCVVVSVAAGMVDYFLKRDNFVTLPKEVESILPMKRWVPLIIGRAIISICAGWLVWVVLSGGMPTSKENYLRLLFMSFVVGFAAPSLALRYREKIESIIASAGKNHG